MRKGYFSMKVAKETSNNLKHQNDGMSKGKCSK